MDTVPADILRLILIQLPPLQLIQIERLCKRLYQVLHSLRFWELMKPHFAMPYDDLRMTIQVLANTTFISRRVNIQAAKLTRLYLSPTATEVTIVENNYRLIDMLGCHVMELNKLGYHGRTIRINYGTAVPSKFCWSFTCPQCKITIPNLEPCCQAPDSKSKKWAKINTHTITYTVLCAFSTTQRIIDPEPEPGVDDVD